MSRRGDKLTFEKSISWTIGPASGRARAWPLRLIVVTLPVVMGGMWQRTRRVESICAVDWVPAASETHDQPGAAASSYRASPSRSTRVPPPVVASSRGPFAPPVTLSVVPAAQIGIGMEKSRPDTVASGLGGMWWWGGGRGEGGGWERGEYRGWLREKYR